MAKKTTQLTLTYTMGRQDNGISPLGHGVVSVHGCAQGDVDAAHGVEVAEHQQHGPGHGLEHLHDALEAVQRHVLHVGRLLAAQHAGQAQLPHVDGPLQEHLAEQEVLCRTRMREGNDEVGNVCVWVKYPRCHSFHLSDIRIRLAV